MSNSQINVSIPLMNEESAAKQLSWVVRVFFCSICESYLHGAQRRVEAMTVALHMVNSAHQEGSITSEEFIAINSEISNIEKEMYPGRCSV